MLVPQEANYFFAETKILQSINYIGWHSESVLLEVYILKGSWERGSIIQKTFNTSNVFKPKRLLHSIYSGNCFANKDF